MLDKYLIVNKEILPDVYDKVIQARNSIYDGSCKGVSDAVKKVGISRSTYYKYKDYVFSPSENSTGRKAVIGLMLVHKSGVLSEVINLFTTANANILTMNQSIPINGKASVNISIEMKDINISIDELIEKLKEKEGVNGVNLLSIE